MIVIVAALTKDRVIGKDNELPWYVPEDLQLFKQTTKDNTIIMGRCTFESLGKPLPDRQNIVVSTTMGPTEGVQVVRSFEEALAVEPLGHCTFVIGGGKIFEEALPLADAMFLSWIKERFEGDAYFPEFDFKDWEEVHDKDYRDFVHKIYLRISKEDIYDSEGVCGDYEY